jgi:hypothetical protein
MISSRILLFKPSGWITSYGAVNEFEDTTTVTVDPSMIGDTLNVAFGVSTYISCRNTTLSTCVFIPDLGDEVCTLGGEVELSYKFRIKYQAWGQNAVSDWITVAPEQERSLVKVKCTS